MSCKSTSDPALQTLSLLRKGPFLGSPEFSSRLYVRGPQLILCCLHRKWEPQDKTKQSGPAHWMPQREPDTLAGLYRETPGRHWAERRCEDKGPRKRGAEEALTGRSARNGDRSDTALSPRWASQPPDERAPQSLGGLGPPWGWPGFRTRRVRPCKQAPKVSCIWWCRLSQSPETNAEGEQNAAI